MTKKKVGMIVDILMYLLLVTQMLYVFTGNNIHEIIGIAFFVCLVIHIVLKKWWFQALFAKGKSASRRFFDFITLLLLLLACLLMISSMDVSRWLFPQIRILGNRDIHVYLATAVLTLGVLHGGSRILLTRKNRSAFVLVILAAVAGASLGLFGVPYINRHLKTVEVDFAEQTMGDHVEWKGKKPLIVYFTRMGNTDFEPDVDAVSGASLLISDGEMMGSNQLLAYMAGDILDTDPVAITLRGKKYPSSYGDTVAVAGEELRANARPAIEPVDVLSDSDALILIYPLWWGSIPMPVATFLEENDFDNKTIYLIITQGSSGFGSTVSEIKELCPGANVVEGTSIYCEDIPDARDELLKLIRKWNAEN